MTWRSAATLLMVTCLMCSAGPAGATERRSFGGQAEKNQLTIRSEYSAAHEAARTRAEQARASIPGPQRITVLVVACQGNGPQESRTNSIYCDSSRLGCEHTPAPDDILYWVWPGTRHPDGSVEFSTGTRDEVCLAADDAGDPALPEFTLADFQSLPLPAGAANIQPPNGYTIINVETNVYAVAQPVTLDTTLLGMPVQVRATPARYAWDFGDGHRFGPHADPGAPYPALRITNTYTEPGRYDIILTTYYSGEYSVAGGPWLPIAGEAEVSSPPQTVQALSGRNRLVADLVP